MTVSKQQYPEITKEDIEREVRSLAEKYPDYVYSSIGGACNYSNEDKDFENSPPELKDCDCIFGAAFLKLGFTPAQLFGV